jgi:hypothetical protein
MSWSGKYKRSIDCDNPKGFSQRAHCQARKKRRAGDETKSKSPFSEAVGEIKYSKFSHKTKHLKGIQHQLDPNLDLKQLVHHATMQYVDRDADGDVDVFDNPKKKTPDENPIANFATASKVLIKKQKGEVKHTRRGVAFEGNLHKWFSGSRSKDGKAGWVNVVTGGTCASDEPGEGVPKCVSSEKRASMTKAERLSASRRKKKADKGQQQKSGAAKPTYVSTDNPKKKMAESKDHEYSMARSELSTIMNAARRLKSKMGKGEGEIEAWVQSKITKAADYLDSAADYVDSGEMKEESDVKGKGSGNKDACYHKVKSRYDVWPSAYASGALVKCRKVGAKNWGNKSEGWTYELNDDYYSDLIEKCWPGYEKKGMKTMFGKRYPNCVKKEEIEIQEKIERYNEIGQTVVVMIRWRGKYYKLQFFFPGPKFPTRQEVTVQVQKFYPDAVVMSHQPSETDPTEPTIRVAEEVLPDGPAADKRNPQKPKKRPQGGDKRPGLEEQEDKERRGTDFKGRDYGTGKQNKTIPPEGVMQANPDGSLPKLKQAKKPSNTQMAQYEPEGEMVEDWQSVNRKDKTDGLSQAAVNAYRRENPGSKLQTAVTEKSPKGKRAKRRLSFCRRMKGMKKRLTSAETARDPDSRINKALRRWNCN